MAFHPPTSDMCKHLKPLYIKAHINGKMLSKVIVDGGAILNVMSINTLWKMDKDIEDLTTTNMKMVNFNGDETHTL